MTDIMKLADGYAECMYLRRERHDARAALQSAIEALIAERDAYQQAADKMAAEHKVELEALQAENERLKEEAKQRQSLSELSLGMAEAHSKERHALQAKCAGLEHVKNAFELQMRTLQAKLDAHGIGDTTCSQNSTT